MLAATYIQWNRASAFLPALSLALYASGVGAEEVYKGVFHEHIEAYTFLPCASEKPYWVASPDLETINATYRALTTTPSEEIYAEFLGTVLPKPLGEQYDAEFHGLHVSKILTFEKLTNQCEAAKRPGEDQWPIVIN